MCFKKSEMQSIERIEIENSPILKFTISCVWVAFVVISRQENSHSIRIVSHSQLVMRFLLLASTSVNTVIWLMQHLVYKNSWIMQSWFLSSAQFMIGFWMFAGFHVFLLLLRIDFCFHFVLFHSANHGNHRCVYYDCGCNVYSAPFHWVEYYSNDLDEQQQCRQWTHTHTHKNISKYAVE